MIGRLERLLQGAGKGGRRVGGLPHGRRAFVDASYEEFGPEIAGTRALSP